MVNAKAMQFQEMAYLAICLKPPAKNTFRAKSNRQLRQNKQVDWDVVIKLGQMYQHSVTSQRADFFIQNCCSAHFCKSVPEKGIRRSSNLELSVKDD